LCIVGTDEEVYRETIETGAVLLRMAPSHVRFGSFEVFFHRRQHEHLKTLADHVIERHYPEVRDAVLPYAAFYEAVVVRTARLVAAWQAVGFAHGVMNTDNMSIVGLTLDYGPYGFMDAYDPGFVCNHSDYHGRYAFDQQPAVALWNLTRLAHALSPLLPPEPAREALDLFETVLVERYAELMRAKLGLMTAEREDGLLMGDLLERMARDHVDYTLLFRRLGDFSQAPDASNAPLRDMFMNREGFDKWARQYRERLQREGSDDRERRARMQRVNPLYVLRNYLAEIAIRKANEERDFSEIDRLRELLRDPFSERPDMVQYAAEPPDWARHIEVSCSS
jgi:uncharacterized protein YdiU (UPF0061 family)